MGLKSRLGPIGDEKTCYLGQVRCIEQGKIIPSLTHVHLFRSADVTAANVPR